MKTPQIWSGGGGGEPLGILKKYFELSKNGEQMHDKFKRRVRVGTVVDDTLSDLPEIPSRPFVYVCGFKIEN